MWKRAPYILSVVMLVLLATVSARPNAYRIERRASIAASTTALYARLVDLREWQRWSPWEQLDPRIERTFDGPTEGLGASYSFEGGVQVGKGRLTLTEAEPGRRVVYRVEFEKPWRTAITHEFQLATGEGGTTRMTWTLEGQHHFWGKLFALVTDVDHAVGGDMARGLQVLRELTEHAASLLRVQRARGPMVAVASPRAARLRAATR